MARKSDLSFAKDTSGNVAIIFAVVSTAIISILGLGIDFQRSVSAEQNIQSALDATSLAAVRAMQDASNTETEIRTYAENVFAANIQGSNTNLNCPKPTVTVDFTTGKVEADINCTLPTTLAGIFSIREVKIGQSSVANMSMSKLDLAMMLDVSGSMSGQKIKDLKSAANDAIDTLITARTGDRVRIAFNTYSTAVNVGSYAKTVKGNNYDATSATRDCVTERGGIAKFKDDAPGTGKYLEETTKSADNKALSCPSSSLEPLSTDKDKLQKAINGLSANGWTAGHLGIAWAWYLISPDWDKIWPKDSKPLDYDDNDTIKAVILMTDGEFNTYYQNGQGNSVGQSKKLCNNMKKEGVIVYSVAFQAPKAGKDVLKACASNDDTFYDASSGTELKEAYAAIASQLTNLRLTR